MDAKTLINSCVNHTRSGMEENDTREAGCQMRTPIKPFIFEYRAEKISKGAHAISAIAQLIEKLRAHNSGECPLEEDDISKLAKNGYILSGLANAIDMMSLSIAINVEELLEAPKPD